MIKKFTLLTATLFVLSYANAQTGNVGIGTAAPDASSVLDITSTDKGLLIPRVSIGNVSTFGLSGSTNTPGMLVYNTNASTTGGSGVGFYYWTGSVWTKVVAGTLATLNNGQIWIGNASNQPVANTISGDATISNTGVLDLSNGAVETSEIADGAVTTIKIADNAVDGTKINLTSNANGDLMYYNGTDWVRLAAGTSGQILRTNGAAAPTWSNPNDLLTFQNGLTETSPNIVELGGALTKATTISGLTATNKMSFTGTGVDVFNIDGSTFSINATNDRVGIGTTAPDNTLTVNNAGTTGSNTSSYPLGIQRAGSTDLTLGSDANYAFLQSWNSKPLLINAQGNYVGIGTSSAPKERLHIDGNVLSNKNYIATQGIVTGKLETKEGPGTGTDGAWHTVELSNGYGGTSISAYATGDFLDGEIKIQGVDISDLLDNSTIGWYTTDAGNTWKSVSTSKDASSGLTNNDTYYQVYCPNDYIATGWQAYANARLDYYLKLRCTKLKSAYGTVESNQGIESLMSSPRNTGDNITHFSACPAGTFIKGLYIRANSYLDGYLTVFCTGIKLK